MLKLRLNLNKIMKIINFLKLISILLLLQSCDFPLAGRNHLLKLSGWDQKISQDRYKIQYFAGSNKKDAIDMLLLKASQITLKNNKKTFEAQPVEMRYLRDMRVILVKIILNTKPSKNTEIVFNAAEICQSIMDKKEDIIKKRIALKSQLEIINCGNKESPKAKKLNSDKLDNYYNIFEDIIRGNYLVE